MFKMSTTSREVTACQVGQCPASSAGCLTSSTVLDRTSMVTHGLNHQSRSLPKV
ncbi:unnamed protein product [Ectocarpus sp. 13 AM-2016]